MKEVLICAQTSLPCRTNRTLVSVVCAPWPIGIVCVIFIIGYSPFIIRFVI
jgi:hypothetical protein